MSSKLLESSLERFCSLTSKPTKYLTVQNDIRDDIKQLVKDIYDVTKSVETVQEKSKTNALPELIIENFDEEQIWQEIELQNSSTWDSLVWEVANCINLKNDLEFPIEINEDQPEPSEGSISEDVEEEIGSDEEEHQVTDKKSKIKTKQKQSIVDDQFFKLQEMEKFLINEEKNEGRPTEGSDDESIDMFQDIDDDDGDSSDGDDNKDMMYNDFFSQEDQDDEQQIGDDKSFDDNDDESVNESKNDKKNKKSKDKKVRFAEINDDKSDESDSENEKDNEPEEIQLKPKPDESKSDFELRQQRIKQQISKLENKILSDAPWQLKGEVDALKRPENSLLQEVVDFDLTTRPAPIITEQTTITLEDIIKRRIKDKAWDDVEKKEKPVEDVLAFRKTEILDQSKSKKSLAEIYETEYLKQKNNTEEQESEPESHKEITNAMNKLFSKLDALCNHHFTPKAPQADIKIVSNTPAINMEEVAPIAMSNAALLAPEEIKKKTNQLISKEERTDTDRNRERRKKKKLQKEKGRVAKVTDHRNTKKAQTADDKSLKTSKAFFQQLNDDTTSLIKKKRNVTNKGQ